MYKIEIEFFMFAIVKKSIAAKNNLSAKFDPEMEKRMHWRVAQLTNRKQNWNRIIYIV